MSRNIPPWWPSNTLGSSNSCTISHFNATELKVKELAWKTSLPWCAHHQEASLGPSSLRCWAYGQSLRWCSCQNDLWWSCGSRRQSYNETVKMINGLNMQKKVGQKYSKSMFAVASSITSMWFFRRRALARQTSCLCPIDKFEPPSVMVNESRNLEVPFRYEEVSLLLRPIASTTLFNVSSSNWWTGSKLFLSDPLKRKGSCGMIEILDLSSSKFKFLMSRPPTRMWPLYSAIRKRALINDVFPAPVRPTIPIWRLMITKR